jgi:3(or 17)beta-hydroxysteroid dehydrogenase
MTRLAEKVVLITGGTNGIGLAVAENMLQEGAHAVIITGRDCERGMRACRKLGDRVLYLEQDVKDEDRWNENMYEISKRFQRLDVLVNNAGHAGTEESQNPEELTLSEWQRIMAVNLDGVFLGCRAAIAMMKTGSGGSIVNMSSTAGLMSTPAFVAYGAAKAGVAQLTKSVAVYCARKGYQIRCNSVHPALIDTSLSKQIFHYLGDNVTSAREGYLARVPLGTLGTPQDVAPAVVYLASDESRYVTGTHLVVGGGLGV